jgi:hypothetical protein
MTATPPRADLRTLAAEAIDAAIDATGREHGDPQPNGEELVDAVLAAVLPEHRRMVLAEAADDLHRVATHLRATNPDSSVAKGVRYAEARIRAQLTAAPPAGLSATVPAGNAPAVPEEAGGQRAGEGDALTYAEMESERDRLARELHEAQTELALVKSRPLFSTRKVMQTLLGALGDPVDEQELILRIDDGLRLADVAQRVIAALALTAAERDVVEAAKAWRGNRYASASILELAAAVDALSDAGIDQTEDGHGV